MISLIDASQQPIDLASVGMQETIRQAGDLNSPEYGFSAAAPTCLVIDVELGDRVFRNRDDPVHKFNVSIGRTQVHAVLDVPLPDGVLSRIRGVSGAVAHGAYHGFDGELRGRSANGGWTRIGFSPPEKKSFVFLSDITQAPEPFADVCSRIGDTDRFLMQEG